MITLGIESTAHTFGIGIVDENCEILANERAVFTTEEGGMIPFEVSEHHVQECDKILEKALDKAGLKIKDIDLISFSQGPGIGNCLRIGAVFARSLSVINKKPLILNIFRYSFNFLKGLGQMPLSVIID